MLRIFSAAAVGVALLSSAAMAQAPAERRVALIIGNATYKEQPLKNPANDARAMAATLRQLGFEVIARENATRDAMGAAVGEFTRKLTPGVVALFYYAGHGVQSRGRNYLIPVDATLGAESDLRFQAIDVSALTEEMDQAQARVSMVILDACRNNPFERRLRGAGRGLVAVDAARGGLIAYATAPGSVAADGDGANGTYTEELVKALAVPNLKVEEVFKRVTGAVEQRTSGQQTPWISSSLRGDFIFNIKAAVTPATVSPGAAASPSGSAATSPGAAPSDREALFWQSAQASNRIEEYREYLKQYPQGTFAGLARSRIAGLQAAAKPPAPAAAPAASLRPDHQLEPIDREFVARESARIREAPDLGSKVVATLSEGDAVYVLGKLRDQSWYKVEREGRPIGFVATAVVEEAASYRKRKAEERSLASAPPAVAAPTPPPEPEFNIGGLYRAAGTNPNGTAYTGTCRISERNGVYTFFWQVGSTYRGTGQLDGDELTINWGQNYPVIYEVRDGGRVLDGTWNNGNATEILTRID